MIKPRLITFGCSHTYGDALPDCVCSFTDPPSKYSWPAILGKYLHRKVVNNAISGNGNLEILWNILNFEFQEDDLCIVMWSYYTRDHMFAPDGFLRFSRENIPEKLKNAWMTTHSDYDLYIRNWLYFHHGDLYLSNTIQNSFHIVDYIIQGVAGVPNDDDDIPSFVSFDNTLNVGFRHRMIDHGTDQLHPGVNSHNKLAKEIFHALPSKLKQGNK